MERLTRPEISSLPKQLVELGADLAWCYVNQEALRIWHNSSPQTLAFQAGKLLQSEYRQWQRDEFGERQASISVEIGKIRQTLFAMAMQFNVNCETAILKDSDFQVI